MSALSWVYRVEGEVKGREEEQEGMEIKG